MHDLRPFKDMLHSDAFWLMLTVIGIGAPLSEELLFRGFLFSGLAKSKLGLLGAGVLTSLLWTLLHLGYSIFGLTSRSCRSGSISPGCWRGRAACG